MSAGLDVLNAAKNPTPATQQPATAASSADPETAAGLDVLNTARSLKPTTTTQATTTQAATATEPVYDELGLPIGDQRPGQDVANRVLDAVKQGWNNTQPALTPKGEAAVGPAGSFVSSALLDNPRRALNALTGGVSQGVMEATSPLPEGARLGRDINQLMQVAPAAGVLGEANALRPTPPRSTPYPEIPPGGWRFRPEGEAAPGAATPVAPSVPASPAFVPPGTPSPPPPAPVAPEFVPPGTRQPPPTEAAQPGIGGAPAPNSVGAAATPSGLTAMSPREAAASQADAESYRLLNPRPPGRDTTEYVPGVAPTEAEFANNSDVAARQNYVSQTPGQKNIFDARQKANNNARVDYFLDTAGTKTQVNTLKEARSQQATTDLDAAFKNKAPTDLQPVVETVQQILNDPRNSENTALQKYIAPILDRLHNADGTLKSDPEVIYGLREDVNRSLSKVARAENPTLAHVSGEMQEVKSALDVAIEQGAPGYRQYLQNYAEASRPIDTLERIQEDAHGIINGAERTITFAGFDRFMKDLIAERKAPGVNQAKSISDDTMERLWNIHADLNRYQSAVNAGKVVGQSPTSMLGRIGEHAKDKLGSGAAAFVPGGNVALEAWRTRKAERMTAAEVNRLLNPPENRLTGQ